MGESHNCYSVRTQDFSAVLFPPVFFAYTLYLFYKIVHLKDGNLEGV